MKRLWSGTAVVILLAAGAARADLITSPGQISGPAQTLGFSQFAGSTTYLTSPVQVGTPVGQNITVSSTDPANSFIGDSPSGPYALGNNGQFLDTAGRGYVALNSIDLNTFQLTGTLTFRFNSGPVGQVGAFLNYLPDPGSPPLTIAALSANGSVLESFDLSQLPPPGSPGGIDQTGFFGIARNRADIAGFAVSNDFALVQGLVFSAAASPTATTPAAAVPEPGTLGLLGLGLVGLFACGRRRRAGTH